VLLLALGLDVHERIDLDVRFGTEFLKVGLQTFGGSLLEEIRAKFIPQIFESDFVGHFLLVEPNKVIAETRLDDAGDLTDFELKSGFLQSRIHIPVHEKAEISPPDFADRIFGIFSRQFGEIFALVEVHLDVADFRQGYIPFFLGRIHGDSDEDVASADPFSVVALNDFG